MGISNVTFGGTNVSYGLYANRPTAAIGGQYLATDEQKLYACYIEGVWQVVSPTLAQLIVDSTLPMIIDSDTLLMLIDNLGDDLFVGVEAREGADTSVTTWITRRSFTILKAGTYKFGTSYDLGGCSSASGFVTGVKWVHNGDTVYDDSGTGKGCGLFEAEVEAPFGVGDTMVLQVIYNSATVSRKISTRHTGIRGTIQTVATAETGFATYV